MAGWKRLPDLPTERIRPHSTIPVLPAAVWPIIGRSSMTGVAVDIDGGEDSVRVARRGADEGMTISQTSIDELFTPATSDGEGSGGVASGSAPASATAATSMISPAPRGKGDIGRILGLSVPVGVTLAQRAMTIESILEITVGTIIEFDLAFDAELTLQVGDRTIGRGQAVKVGENFGLRITHIDSVPQRIGALGSH